MYFIFHCRIRTSRGRLRPSEIHLKQRALVWGRRQMLDWGRMSQEYGSEIRVACSELVG